MMKFSLPGIHVPHRKHTEDSLGERMTAVGSVTIPTVMHIGKPARVCVKVGDAVSVGTLIAEADGALSSPIYASVSGKVTKIVDMMLSNGKTAPAVVITSDGAMTPDQGITPPKISSREDLIEAIRRSGIVGLGGAGFPTHVKFAADPDKIEALVINGAECEPYITSDTVTMLTRAADIATALRVLMKYLAIPRVIIAIENNKKKAIAAMEALASTLEGVEVRVLDSRYPQGAEKVLVYHTLGRVIPMGKLPLDVGCIVANVTTVAAIGSYLSTGMPLVEKCITVDGGSVKTPKNITVPIGTSLADVFAYCGGFTSEPAKVIYGGPMMGTAVNDMTAPVLKNTTAILALTEKEAKLPKTTACIRCGSCTNHCPFGLNPAAMARAYERRDAEALQDLCLSLCMECGSCSFICPANRPLVQTNKLAKAYLREMKAKEGT
ncbi:MAG: electron transport complex subunit RsxC [Clostridia bacterium]|nr:electron transport complex subunit RsxC [Clostridia bacterium]